MKKKLLRLCSIVLVISMVLGNLVSLAADAESTETTETTTGMKFSEYRKGVIDNPFESDSNEMTVEATIQLSEDAGSYTCVILSARGKSKAPELNFGIYHQGGKARPWIYYYKSGMVSSYNAYFDYDFIAKSNYEQTHITFILGENEEGTATTVACYVDGEEVSLASDSIDYTLSTENPSKGTQPVVMFDKPTIAYCVGGDYASDQSARYFKGEIYSVATYTDVRTADEITTDKDGIDDTSDENLMAYYDLTSVTDATTKVENGSTTDTTQQYALNIVETWMTERKPALSDWDKENGDFSIAIVGDTQIATEYDVCNGHTEDGEGVVSGIYDWLIDNRDEKNIQFVMGLGDIVQGTPYAKDGTTKDPENIEAEWVYARTQIQKLDEADMPYSLIRGNHDAQNYYTQYISYDAYLDDLGGSYDETALNTWQEFEVNGIKYLVLCLDLGASDAELAWAEEIIKAHPYHNVIITTHAYLNSNGERLTSTDTHHPSQYYSSIDGSNRNDGDNMWDDCFSKYDNVVMVVSGHIGTDDVILSEDTGVNGNKVAQLLVDPQNLDDKLVKSSTGERKKPTGMVCVLNFSADGKTVQVEQISTAYTDETTGNNEYYMNTSQFEFEMNVMKEQKILFDAQEMDTRVEGQQTFTALIDGEYKRTSCATKYAQIILSAGYTNIVSYTAPSDGLIKMSDMTLKFHGSVTNSESEIYKVTNGSKAVNIEFAITDDDGNIISNGGRVLILGNNQVSISGLTIDEREIEKGESIHFIFHGITGDICLVNCIPTIEFSEDEGNTWTTVSSLASGCYVPWPAVTSYTDEVEYTDATAVQGMGGFYYQYSTMYHRTNCFETEEKVNILARRMSAPTASSTFFYHPSSSNNAQTRYGNIIVKSGYTNIISYMAPQSGRIYIDDLYVYSHTQNSSTVTNFSLINEEGKILSNNGTVYTVNGYDTAVTTFAQQQANAVNLAPVLIDVEKGECIYFVFYGVSGTNDMRCNANIQFCADGETTWTCVSAYSTAGAVNINSLRVPDSTSISDMSQGGGNFFYEYSDEYEILVDTESGYIQVPDDGKIMTNYRLTSDKTTVDFPFRYGSGDKCETNYGQIITSEGYTNVIAYETTVDGTLRIDDMKVWIKGNGTGKTVEFAVADKDGKILTNNGKMYTMNSYTTGTEAGNAAVNLPVDKLEMKAGERIYFVFHGTLGNTAVLACNPIILFDEEGDNIFEQIQTEFHQADVTLYSKELDKTYSATDYDASTLQGTGGFYYMYLTENTSNPTGMSVGTEEDGVVTIYEPITDNTTYLDKHITVADDGTISYVDLDMLNIKKQSKVNPVDEATNGENATLTDIRFIASVDNLSYQKAGFLFTLDATKEMTVDNTIEGKTNQPTTKVYTKMLEEGTYRKASNLYADDGCNTAYGFAFEMTKIPISNGTPIYVRAYVQLSNGNYVYGDVREINVTAAGIVE